MQIENNNNIEIRIRKQNPSNALEGGSFNWIYCHSLRLAFRVNLKSGKTRACEASSAEECWERFGREYEFGGHKAAFLARKSLRHHLILYRPCREQGGDVRFMTPAKTLQDDLSLERVRAGIHGCW